MSQIDPSLFIISRKRKKYKFAKFANASNCFEYHQWISSPERASGVDVVEIGAGTGLFGVELALRFPEKVFVAVDVKADRLQKGAYAALEKGTSNVYFVRARADQVGELFAPISLESIWLTFSDPFPKKRSAGRRMTHPTFLAKYASLLKSGGELRIKHDDPVFFKWSLEQLVREGWHISELSFDLHESGLDDNYKILTSYEERWLSEGRITQHVSARRD